MNQSSFIAGALLAGFVLWLASQRRLSAYTAVLWGNTAVAPPSGGSGSSGGSGDIAHSLGSAASSFVAHAAIAAVTGGAVP